MVEEEKMNRNDARKLADIVTNEQLKQMFDNAKVGVKDWTKVSSCNLGFTKGVAWNILAKDFDVTKPVHVLGKTNMIREFGEFLPGELKQKVTRQKEVLANQYIMIQFFNNQKPELK